MEKIYPACMRERIAARDLPYCAKVLMSVSDMFCKTACKGDYIANRAIDVEELRSKNRPALNKAQLNNKDMVTVFIPVCSADSKYLDKTMKNAFERSTGPLEFIVKEDTEGKGIRVMMNEAANEARGRYFVKLDCHCALSPEWDARMKLSCKENTLVKPMLDDLNENTWGGLNKDMGLIVFNSLMQNQFVNNTRWKPIGKRWLNEETMSLLGCCFMVQKKDYFKHGGCDEKLPPWGALGAEWSLKFWLSGGKCLIRTDTVCYHLFRKKAPFAIDAVRVMNAFKALYQRYADGKADNQVRSLQWLVEKFEPYLSSSNVITSSGLGNRKRSSQAPIEA